MPAAALASVAAVRRAAPPSADQARLYGPRSACLTARAVRLEVVSQASTGSDASSAAAVGQRLDAGGLLRANGGLHEGLGGARPHRAADAAASPGAWRTSVVSSGTADRP